MRILFVASQIPYPPVSGMRIALYYPMRLMREAGHSLALAVLSDETDNIPARVRRMEEICDHVLFHPLPNKSRCLLALKTLVLDRLYFMERFRCGPFALALRQLISAFAPEVVHFDTIPVTQYRDAVPPGIGTVASINDSYTRELEVSLSRKPAERMWWYRRFQLRQSRRYEATEFAKFSFCHTMTEIDGEYLRQLNPRTRCIAIPNAVNADLFDMAGPATMSTVLCIPTGCSNPLDRLTQFVTDGWQAVRARHPLATLQVRGPLGRAFEKKRPPPFAQKAGGVSFLGFAESLAELYGEPAVLVLLQDQDCGLVTKAIEAMACQRVVVGFRRTFRGILGAEEGVHYLAGDDWREIGEAVAGILSDAERAKSIGMQARRLVSGQYRWEHRMGPYDRMYREAARLGRMEACGNQPAPMPVAKH